MAMTDFNIINPKVLIIQRICILLDFNLRRSFEINYWIDITKTVLSPALLTLDYHNASLMKKHRPHMSVSMNSTMTMTPSHHQQLVLVFHTVRIQLGSTTKITAQLLQCYNNWHCHDIQIPVTSFTYNIRVAVRVCWGYPAVTALHDHIPI